MNACCCCCFVVVVVVPGIFYWVHPDRFCIENQETFDVICSLKSAKVVDGSWGYNLNISNMLSFVAFFWCVCVCLSKIAQKTKINDINCAVFIWFAASSAAPIAQYTCATSNSLRFPLLPFWKFLALTHGIWQVSVLKNTQGVTNQTFNSQLETICAWWCLMAIAS